MHKDLLEDLPIGYQYSVTVISFGVIFAKIQPYLDYIYKKHSIHV